MTTSGNIAAIDYILIAIKNDIILQFNLHL